MNFEDLHELPSNPFNAHAWIAGNPEIGDDVWIGAFCVIDGSGGLTIGNGCDISAGAHIYTHSTVKRAITEGTAEIARNRTNIGAHCHLGANSVVLMGCNIGHHSIVGAGAVVIEGTDAPPYSLLVGVPARIINGGALKQ